MSKKMTTFDLDLDSLPPLTAEQESELKALDAKQDNEIDFSDIPLLEERFWSHAIRSGAYKPVKASTTVRVDADVLLWLRSKGKGYQTRINSILRTAMLREMGNSNRSETKLADPENKTR